MATLIKVQHGMQKKIREVFKVSQPTVRRALALKSHSKKAVKIRAYALANGGTLLESNK